MKKLIILIALIAVLAGCSSKTIHTDALGSTTVTTKTDESSFNEAQALAWAAYYSANATPRVIASITSPDGTITNIHSQIRLPAPVITQHKNQVIGPMADIFKTAIQWGAGSYAASQILDDLAGTTINNLGNGNVDFQKDNTNVAVDSSANNSVTSDDSDNSIRMENFNNPDNHIENADPVVVDPVVVRPEVVIPGVE